MRKLVITLASILVLLVILTGGTVYLAPTLLSSSWAQPKLIELINAQMTGKMRVEWKQLKLQWLGEQRIEGIDIYDGNCGKIGHIHFISTHTSLISLGISIWKKQAITLTAPLVAEMPVTPELGRFLAKEVPLVLGPLMSSPNPIQLEISDEGLYIPLSPFSFEKMAVPTITLTLGKITALREGLIAVIVTLGKPFKFASNKTLLLWFTPLHASIDQGILTCKRMDVLIDDTLHVASWGTVDLVKSKANLTLGISGSSATSLFGLPSLPGNAMMTLPMNGSLGSVALDVRSLSTVLGALVPGVGIFGAIAGQVAGAAMGSGKVPPPSDPLPWGDK